MIETPEHVRGPEYYDSVFVKDLPWYSCDPEKSHFYSLWKRMLELSKHRIIDIGCGPGQVAQLAVRMGHEYVCGIDYSLVAVARARERCPELMFLYEDVSYITEIKSHSYDTCFICETLEHLEDDVGFLKKIPAGKHVVASVPMLCCLGHARYFEGETDVRERYSLLVGIDYMETINKWILFSGHRRGKLL